MFDNDTSHITRKVAMKCEEMGEERVRKSLATGFFTDEWRPHAERWLANLDHERNSRQQSDTIRHANSAKTAAWAAAIAAIVAAITAIASVVISFQSGPS